MNKNKRVRFHFMRDIWIIPNKEDIIDAGLKDELWWSQRETDNIKSCALRELKTVSWFNKNRTWLQLSKTIWCTLDFDEIDGMIETYKLTNKIELKKLYELYTIKSTQ